MSSIHSFRRIPVPATTYDVKRGGRTRSFASWINRVYGDRGEREDEYRPFPNRPGKNRRQALVEIPVMVRVLSIPQGKRVLEVGCGSGVGLVGLQKGLQPRRLVGIDTDRSLLGVARDRLDALGKTAELFWSDVRRMPFQDASFDVVIDFGTCFHIAHPHRALGEISRVLDTNGVFIHETRVAQLLSHPIRSLGRAMPLEWFPQLRVRQWRGLWTMRQKC